MTHFAAGSWLGLAVEMKFDERIFQCGSPVWLAVRPKMAEEICHSRRLALFGRAKRQAAHSTHLLLELAGDASIDGEVSGVVRARSQFVHEQTIVLRYKHLHGQKT